MITRLQGTDKTASINNKKERSQPVYLFVSFMTKLISDTCGKKKTKCKSRQADEQSGQPLQCALRAGPDPDFGPLGGPILTRGQGGSPVGPGQSPGRGLMGVET